jgi:hypothetical protein
MRSDNPVNQKEQNIGVLSMGCLFALLRLLILTPIWYYLLYQIISMVHGTDAMWIMFWIYLPAGVVINIFEEIMKKLFSNQQ